MVTGLPHNFSPHLTWSPRSFWCQLSSAQTPPPPGCLANHRVCVWGGGAHGLDSQSAFRSQSTRVSIYPSCDHEQLFNSFLHCFSVCKTGVIVAPASPGVGGLHAWGSTCPALAQGRCQWLSVARGPTHLHVQPSVSVPGLRTKPLYMFS